MTSALWRGSRPPTSPPDVTIPPAPNRQVIRATRHEMRTSRVLASLAVLAVLGALAAWGFAARGGIGWVYAGGAAIVAVATAVLMVASVRQGVVLDGARFGVRRPLGTTAWVDLDRVVLAIPAVIVGYNVRSVAPVSTRRVSGPIQYTLAFTLWAPRQGFGPILTWVVRRRMPERQRPFVERARAAVPHLRAVRFDHKFFDMRGLEAIVAFLDEGLPERQADQLRGAHRYGRLVREYIARDWQANGPPTRARRRKERRALT